MIKIIGIIFSSLICSVLLKNKHPYFSIIISVTGSLIVFSLIINQLSDVKKRLISYTSQLSSFSSYISLMIKALLIVLITQLVSDFCRDSGNSALASATEISSKIIVVAMCLPLFESLLNIVLGFVK